MLSASLLLTGLAVHSSAAVLIDLDLSNDTAANVASGGIGDGTVNVNTNGYFLNRNSTGAPSGRAFNTGATAMSSADTNHPAVGTITWSNSQFNSIFKGTTAFTVYLWINPDTTPGNNAKLLDMGNVQLTAANTGVLTVSVNGTNVNFSGISAWGSANNSKWSMLAVTFSSGNLSVYTGLATSADLAVATGTISATSVNNTTSSLILGNRNYVDNDRPFDGSIGGFYLSTDVANAADIQALFDTQKTGFVAAVPEPGSLSLLGLVVTGLLVRTRRQTV